MANNKTSSLIEVSLLSIGAGLVICIMLPSAKLIYLSFFAIGIYLIGHYFSTRSKFDVFFRNLNLCAGNVYPVLKGKEETKHEIIYNFSLPKGLCINDFEQKKDAIEQGIGKKIIIKYTDKAFETREIKSEKPRYIIGNKLPKDQ